MIFGSASDPNQCWCGEWHRGPHPKRKRPVQTFLRGRPDNSLRAKPGESLPEARQDRAVHAECSNFEVVRYDRAGQWWIESKIPLVLAQHVGVFEAAHRALSAETLGGQINKGIVGGRVFDAKVRILRARHNQPEPSDG